MTKFRHRAKYLLPGSFFNEDESRELDERTVDAALAAAPEHAFAFKLYDTAILDFEFDAGLWRVIPIPQNESPTHYIGGTVYSMDDLENLAHAEGEPDKYRILISNVRQYDGFAIRTCMGNWQPFQNGDILVKERSHAS